MMPALDDAPGLQHDDLVGVDDGRKAVGDGQHGPVAAEGAQFFLNGALGLGVERGGGLVEDQDRRVLEDGAGDGDALLLAAGELEAALADHRVIAARQGGDEVVDAGGAGGGLDLAACGAVAPIGDVVADGVVEQHRVLGHHADGGAQRVLVDIADVRPSMRTAPAVTS
jgi:hypothetical protein